MAQWFGASQVFTTASFLRRYCDDNRCCEGNSWNEIQFFNWYHSLTLIVLVKGILVNEENETDGVDAISEQIMTIASTPAAVE